MKKYINSFSIHFYIVMFIGFVLLSIESAPIITYMVLVFLLLFFFFTFYNRCKNMNEEEFVERLGFKGNKFFDPNID